MCADYHFKICVFADRNVGVKTFAKKCLDNITKFTEIKYSERMMKIGFYFINKTIDIYNRTIGLVFLIGSLKENFTLLWNSWIRDSNMIFLMYDITNVESFNSLSKWFQVIRNRNANFTIPILLVGNKFDLGENREVSKEQVKEFKENNNISSSIEISLKTGKNFERLFTKITRIILKNRDETLGIRIAPIRIEIE